MAAWRRQAERLLPELRDELAEPGLTPGMVFICLLPVVRKAHETSDDDALRRGYAFAQWCWHQHRSPELQNAAAVTFYEHLFDDWSIHRDVVPWIEPSVRESVFTLWEDRLSPEQLDELRSLFSAVPEQRWREVRPLVSRA